MHVRMLSDPVCFPYEFTLLSNGCMGADRKEKFVSPTNLHCSQTKVWFFNGLIKFVSPTNLHCSQTTRGKRFFTRVFVSPTNLHCSQTPAQRIGVPVSLFPLRIYTALKPRRCRSRSLSVCFPYEFTLLSNAGRLFILFAIVCFPYKFTLLSNASCCVSSLSVVCFPYKFTLLSNGSRRVFSDEQVCFPYKFTLLSNSCMWW